MQVTKKLLKFLGALQQFELNNYGPGNEHVKALLLVQARHWVSNWDSFHVFLLWIRHQEFCFENVNGFWHLHKISAV